MSNVSIEKSFLKIDGNAKTATKLATARTVQTNLASTSTASFDGTKNIAPGVTGVLPVANGGTGSSTEKYLKLTGGNINGNLTISGKNVVRTINGTAADANGNVTLSLGGGAVEGYYSERSGRLPNYGSWVVIVQDIHYDSSSGTTGYYFEFINQYSGGTEIRNSHIAIRVA